MGLWSFTFFLFQLIQLRNRLFIEAQIVFQSIWKLSAHVWNGCTVRSQPSGGFKFLSLIVKSIYRQWQSTVAYVEIQLLSEHVIHHCHLTGKVFGMAHSSCNLKARSTSFVPIFYQNLSRYDAHHIIKNLTLLSGEKLSAISRTDKTYISFSVSVPVGSYYTKNHKNATITDNLRFLDSFQFMSQSLDSLAKKLKADVFSLLKTFFSSTHPTVDWKLLTRKGHFPHSYLDSFPKFEKLLPNYGDDWKNTLTGKIDISEADVAQAFKIYTLFGCRNLGDYHDVYLRTDVLILADVFEKIRQVCMKV